MSTSSSELTEGMPEPFLAILIHTPSWRVWCPASHVSKAVPSAKALISAPSSCSLRLNLWGVRKVGLDPRSWALETWILRI
ncbi:hypothetical protein [Streptomyces sp. NPDC058092]|uniref:hypothetical protein n=1 Tax=Streptomyces sp. NPDC058092 TaxID=3346336 RepID=UPI0036F02380